MIIYPSPFCGSSIPLDVVLELVRDFHPSCTEGGVWVSDPDVTLELISILSDNNIPYEDANVSRSERFRRGVRNGDIVVV